MKKTLKEIYGDTVPVIIIDNEGFALPGFIKTDSIEAWYSRVTPNGTTHIIDTPTKSYRVQMAPALELLPLTQVAKADVQQ